MVWRPKSMFDLSPSESQSSFLVGAFFATDRYMSKKSLVSKEWQTSQAIINGERPAIKLILCGDSRGSRTDGGHVGRGRGRFPGPIEFELRANTSGSIGRGPKNQYHFRKFGGNQGVRIGHTRIGLTSLHTKESIGSDRGASVGWTRYIFGPLITGWSPVDSRVRGQCQDASRCGVNTILFVQLKATRCDDAKIQVVLSFPSHCESRNTTFQTNTSF
mmetsp:Transcript_9804/g.21259  ORF Transcript_9804/g.21259 Transcript_9804/m.21259 type:complete len:217 (+) Transcript_9804:174-824(+)